MGKLSSRLDGIEKALSKLSSNPGLVVIVRRFTDTQDQALVGYREVKSGAMWPLDEAQWPRPRVGTCLVVEEVYAAASPQLVHAEGEDRTPLAP